MFDRQSELGLVLRYSCHFWCDRPSRIVRWCRREEEKKDLVTVDWWFWGCFFLRIRNCYFVPVLMILEMTIRFDQNYRIPWYSATVESLFYRQIYVLPIKSPSLHWIANCCLLHNTLLLPDSCPFVTSEKSFLLSTRLENPDSYSRYPTARSF